MRKTLLIVFLLITCLAWPVSAKIVIDEGLVLQNGQTSISMESGQKLYLHTKDDFWRTPRYKKMSYASQNPSIAWVDRYGYIHAQLPGKTVIYARDRTGSAGNIIVEVHSKRKVSRTVWVILLSGFMLCFMAYVTLKLRCFE